MWLLRLLLAYDDQHWIKIESTSINYDWGSKFWETNLSSMINDSNYHCQRSKIKENHRWSQKSSKKTSDSNVKQVLCSDSAPSQLRSPLCTLPWRSLFSRVGVTPIYWERSRPSTHTDRAQLRATGGNDRTDHISHPHCAKNMVQTNLLLKPRNLPYKPLIPTVQKTWCGPTYYFSKWATCVWSNTWSCIKAHTRPNL